MIARYISTSTNTAATAAGVLLLALSAASLGCAFAAYSGGEGAPKIAVTPAFAMPAVQAPAARPVAGVGEPSRCQATQGARARRGHGLCRSVDLPAV
jgi:hypothetical protein